MKRTRTGRPARKQQDDYTYLFPGMELTAEDVEFGLAMQEYQQRYGRRYPAWSEVLQVLRTLGYRKVVAGPERPPPPSQSAEVKPSSP